MAFAQVCLLAVAVVAAQAVYTPANSYSNVIVDTSELGHGGHAVLGHGAQIANIHASHGYEGHQEDFHYEHPQYTYKYGVSDKHTGDYKSQHESRDGDHVVGEYSLIQPDGVIRTVKYEADKHGFHANVHKTGEAIHPSTGYEHSHDSLGGLEHQQGHY